MSGAEDTGLEQAAPATAGPEGVGSGATAEARPARVAPDGTAPDETVPDGSGPVTPAAPARPAPGGPAATPPFPDLARRWPAPAGPAPDVVLAAAAVVGLATAAALPESPTGAGWLHAATIAVAMTLVVRWRLDRAARSEVRTGAPAPRPLRTADVGWTLAVVALCTVPAVRAAEWLAALCLLAAVGSAALALTGRARSALTASLVLPAAAVLRALPWLGRGLRGRPAPLRAAAIVLAGAAVLLVFVPLLASADAAFSAVVATLTPEVDGGAVVRWAFLFGLGAAATGGAAFLLVAAPEPTVGPRRATRLRCLDWALPTGLLVAVFGLFVGVQFVTLFGSHDYVLRTTGVTYAEYARSGFWELLVVTALALGVLAFDSRWAPQRTATERATKRVLLAALAVLTLVVVASAWHRMWLYQQAWGFTVLRVLVLTIELWLGAGFVLALANVLRLRPAGLSRAMLALGVVALLGLAVLDPERFVAEHDVARWAATGELDTEYLSGLSADAVPALVGLPEPQRSCALADVAARLAAPDDWRAANLSRAAARAALAERPPGRCAYDAYPVYPDR